MLGFYPMGGAPLASSAFAALEQIVFGQGSAGSALFKSTMGTSPHNDRDGSSANSSGLGSSSINQTIGSTPLFGKVGNA